MTGIETGSSAATTSSLSAPSGSTGSWAFASPTRTLPRTRCWGLVLDNRDRRFSPENEDTGNPLAGKIQPLRPVRVTSNDGTTTRTHWSGWVESVHPAANKYGERLVKILCTGGLQFLSATETKIELQENQRSDQIIDALALADVWACAAGRLKQFAREEQMCYDAFMISY